MNTKVINTVICVALVLLCGCAKEDPAKAEIRAIAGENREITGAYDETLSAVCRNGTFVGQKDGKVIAFKGVPFAEPPVGALRWNELFSLFWPFRFCHCFFLCLVD